MALDCQRDTRPHPFEHQEQKDKVDGPLPRGLQPARRHKCIDLECLCSAERSGLPEPHARIGGWSAHKGGQHGIRTAED